MYRDRISMNARTFARPKQLFNSLEPGFPCLTDEMAEPRSDMNIKVAAFTVSEKNINMSFLSPLLFCTAFVSFVY